MNKNRNNNYPEESHSYLWPLAEVAMTLVVLDSDSSVCVRITSLVVKGLVNFDVSGDGLALEGASNLVDVALLISGLLWLCLLLNEKIVYHNLTGP